MWGLLIFFVGLLYGWMTPGHQNKGRLFMNGLWIGLLLALVLALLGYYANVSAVPVGAGFLGVFLAVILMTLVFVAGAWLGDLIEGSRRREVY